MPIVVLGAFNYIYHKQKLLACTRKGCKESIFSNLDKYSEEYIINKYTT